MKRRTVIKTILGASALAAGGWDIAGAQSSKPLLLFLHGVDIGTDPDRLFAIVDPLVSTGLPLSVAFDPAPTSAPASSGMRQLLLNLVQNYSGFVELCPQADLDPESNWYQSARAAAEAQTSLRTFITGSGTDVSPPPRLTLVTAAQAESGGIRTAGFRIAVTRPAQSLPVTYSPLSNGVVTIAGGTPITGRLQPEAVVTRIADDLAKNDVVVIHISMSAFAGLDRQAIFNIAARLAILLRATVDDGRARYVLPAEFAAQYITGFTRNLTLRIEGLAATAPQSDLPLELARTLQAAGLPVTLTTPGTELPADVARMARENPALSVCYRFEPSAPASGAEELLSTLAAALLRGENSSVTPACLVGAFNPAELSGAIAEVGLGVVSADTPREPSFVGLDENGILHIPVACQLGAQDRNVSAADLAAKMLREAGPYADALISVKPELLSTPESAAAFRDAVTKLGAQPGIEWVALADLYGKDKPAYRALDLLRTVRRGRALRRREERAPNEAERALLVQDAKIAWTFFERFAHPRSGLTPGSVSVAGDGKSIYPYVTMWDCATQLLALISANLLGLADNKNYLNRTNRILSVLHSADVKSKGLRLPKAFMSYTGSGGGDPGYDASDMGRLLVALKMVEGYTAGSVDVRQIVSGWDLDKTIENRRIHSVKGDRFIDVQNSVYSNYVMRGFRAWGFDVEPAFGITVGKGSVDERLQLLQALSHAEPVGAEPHVLEAVELGHSPFSDLVGNLLYEMQIERYRETGHFVCASEGPLDRDPWFIYQGYRVLAEDNPWVVESPDPNPRYKTEGFRMANEVISTKSAFMWAGVRPEQYSRDLLAHVRDRTRIEGLGFSCGIYAATDRAMPHYTDVNTNGEILEAIAFLLNGSEPLHLKKMEGKG